MARGKARLLFYAINGTGLGHLTRLLNIARAMRELSQALSLDCQIQFLTTSEASHIAHDFPVFKLPSKTVLKACGVTSRQAAAQSKLIISNVMASLRPDLLVVDTVAEGSFKEFLFIKDSARKTVLIERHVDSKVAVNPSRLTHCALYDRILVPDHESQRHRYVKSPLIQSKRRFVGRIEGYRQATEYTWTRSQVCETFSIDPDKFILYISAGGGGDKNSSADLTAILDALSVDDRLVLLVGYGPLYRGPKVYRHNVIPLTEGGVRQYFGGLDGAISAAGYNSYHELLDHEVPTLFFAQKKGWDRQDLRIEMGLKEAWHGQLKSLDRSYIQSKVSQLLTDDSQAQYRQALSLRAKGQGALRAAVECALMLANLKDIGLKRADIEAMAALRQSLKAPLTQSFKDYCAARDFWLRMLASPEEREELTTTLRIAWRQSEAAIENPEQHERWQQHTQWPARLDWRLTEWHRWLLSFFKDGRGDSIERARREETFDRLSETLTSESWTQVFSTLETGQWLRNFKRMVDSEQLSRLIREWLDWLEHEQAGEAVLRQQWTLLEGLSEAMQTQQSSEKFELEDILSQLFSVKEPTTPQAGACGKGLQQ